MKKKVQTVEEMVMRAHYLNALDIESRAEKPLSEMERQDFINTIHDLRETISSLQMTVKTLQKTIDDLNANEKRHKEEIDGLHEMLEFFKNQCEYLQSLNNRHNKQTYSGNSLRQKHRSENRKKGRDEKEQDYTGPDKDNPEGGAAAADDDVTSGVDQKKVKSEGLNDPRGERGKYNKMDAAKTIILETTLEGAPSSWTFLNFKDVDEYSKVSYVLKTTFKVAVFEDEFGVRHDYYVPKDPEDKRRPNANIIPGTHCTPDLYGELASDLYQLHIPIYRESIRHKIDKFQNCKNTDSNWLSAGCKLLMPIMELIKGRLLKLNSVLHIDETWTSIRIKIAGDGTKLGRYKKKYIWCVVNEAEKVTYFFYDNDENDSRGLRPIQEFLAGFEKGTIQSDAYTVYELLTNGNKKLKRVLCWAHVRNRFESAFLSAKDKIADWFVKKIAELYRIENECILARKTPKEIWKRRNAKDVDKILKNLFTKASEYLNSKRRHFSKMTHDALKYMINGWEDLIRYREDGNYDIDNLAAERAIRPFTVHRKNAVSFGSEDGVKEACVYFTLCETCNQYGINFKEYITHVVKEIINGNTNYETLVPWAIKLA